MKMPFPADCICRVISQNGNRILFERLSTHDPRQKSHWKAIGIRTSSSSSLQETSEATQRMIRLVQGDLYGILSKLLRKSHTSISRCYLTRWRKMKEINEKVGEVQTWDQAQNPFVTICRKVIWYSVKSQVPLSTRWATWSWSNWDKPRRLFLVHVPIKEHRTESELDLQR